MADSGVRELVIENRHSGERLAMRRIKRGDEVWLELKGSAPPHRQGPPLHIHLAEDEEGFVRSGTLSAVLNGRRLTAGSGERVSLPRGSAHRWWNDGNEPLVFEGYARPAVDLDRFLQAIFEVLNAGSAGRPKASSLSAIGACLSSLWALQRSPGHCKYPSALDRKSSRKDSER